MANTDKYSEWPYYTTVGAILREATEECVAIAKASRYSHGGFADPMDPKAQEYYGVALQLETVVVPSPLPEFENLPVLHMKSRARRQRHNLSRPVRRANMVLGLRAAAGVILAAYVEQDHGTPFIVARQMVRIAQFLEGIKFPQLFDPPSQAEKDQPRGAQPYMGLVRGDGSVRTPSPVKY